jgi:thiamine kinase-like enzyme
MYAPVSIFKGDGSYLRIGPKDVLEPELKQHKELLQHSFPVPVIISEGGDGDRFYFIEESFGDTLMSDLFSHDCEQYGHISQESFGKFLEAVSRYAKAQLSTIQETKDDKAFYTGVHMDLIQEELPELKEEFQEAFEKVFASTSSFPAVFTHGDFNPHNLFEKGIIDFGSMHHAPAGYDIATMTYHIYNFPKPGDYEYYRRYQFSQEQIQKYFNVMDRIYLEANLPPVSSVVDSYILARMIWSAARMQKYPKIQSWRYGRLRQALSLYLEGKSLAEFTVSD